MFIDQVCCCLQQLSCRIKPIVLGAQRVPEAALETGLKVRCQDWPLGWEGVRKKSHNLDHNLKKKNYHTEPINLRVQLIVESTQKEHSRTSQTWERRMRSCVRRSAGTASGAPPLLGRTTEGRREKGRGENFLAFLLGFGVRWLATSSSMLRVDSSPTATAALGVRVPPYDQMHRLRKRVIKCQAFIAFNQGTTELEFKQSTSIRTALNHIPRRLRALWTIRRRPIPYWMNKKRLYLLAESCHLPRCLWPPHLASLSPCPWCSWSPAAWEAWAGPAWRHNLSWVCQPPNQAWMKWAKSGHLSWAGPKAPPDTWWSLLPGNTTVGQLINSWIVNQRETSVMVNSLNPV